MDLEFLSETNFTILIGIVFTVLVMGISVLYDKKKKTLESETSDGVSDAVSEEKADEKKSLSLPQFNTEKLQASFGNLKEKISSINLTLPPKLANISFKKKGGEAKVAADPAQATTISAEAGLNLDDILESKKEELNFGDDMLSEMATASNITPDESGFVAAEAVPASPMNADAALDSDFEIDSDDFGFGFEPNEVDPSDGMSFGDMPSDDLSFDEFPTDDVGEASIPLDSSFSDDPGSSAVKVDSAPSGGLSSPSAPPNSLPSDDTDSVDIPLDGALSDDMSFGDMSFSDDMGGLDFGNSDDLSDDDAGGFGLDTDDVQIAFGDDSDSLIESLKNEVRVVEEDTVNFMDALEGEDLSLGGIKAELEDVVTRLKRVQDFQQ